MNFNPLVLLASFIFLVSCTTVTNLKHRVLGFNSDKLISIGQNEADVAQHFGPPRIQASVQGKNYLFYDTGFVATENGKVAEVESYEVTYTAEYKFSSYVPVGSKPSIVFKSLGFPQEFKDNIGQQYFRYNNGAILFENNKVVQVVDKLFKDDISYIVKVSAFSDASAKTGGSYFIVPGSSNINANDFLFKELKNYISQSLRNDGMKIVNDQSKADYIVLVNFGISDPKESVEVVSRPIYIPHYAPGRTTNVYGAYGNQIGSIQTSGQWSSQYAGQRTETYTTISYNRWLNVEAIDHQVWKKTKEQVPVWKILTSSEGPSGDLRLVMPALTLGVQNYINRDSGTQLTLRAMPDTLNSYVYETKLLNFSGRDLASKK